MSADTPTLLQIKMREFRKRTGLTIREISRKIGWKSGTTYHHYESIYKKAHLSAEVFLKVKPVFLEYGIPEEEINVLFPWAGINETREEPTPNEKPAQSQLRLVSDTAQPLNSEILNMCFEALRNVELLQGVSLTMRQRTDIAYTLYQYGIEQLNAEQPPQIDEVTATIAYKQIIDSQL